VKSLWNDVKRIQSSDTNVFKYVFEKKDAVAEAVLYKYPTFNERTVVCCSTQSGCPIGCRFCGAGDSFVRSLNADEIVSQTEHLFADKGIDATQVDRMQIMFMSMGEPMLNLKELNPAIIRLHQMYPKAALLISTSAPRVDYQPVIDISKEVCKVGLQFSVHESTDEARNALIPFKNKLTLAEIAEQGVRWANEVGRRPFFNYCAHEKNTSVQDVDRLEKLFDPSVWEATISVVCERDESVAAANRRQRELASNFQSLLLERGFSTRMFDPAGQDDIGGGCGQLWFVQNWMKQNPELARQQTMQYVREHRARKTQARLSSIASQSQIA
jgi:23S rRNA (adenine2503-C2)-methyltransferase